MLANYVFLRLKWWTLSSSTVLLEGKFGVNSFSFSSAKCIMPLDLAALQICDALISIVLSAEWFGSCLLYAFYGLFGENTIMEPSLTSLLFSLLGDFCSYTLWFHGQSQMLHLRLYSSSFHCDWTFCLLLSQSLTGSFSWIPPRLGHVKLNFSGSLIQDFLKRGNGGLVRDLSSLTLVFFFFFKSLQRIKCWYSRLRPCIEAARYLRVATPSLCNTILEDDSRNEINRCSSSSFPK